MEEKSEVREAFEKAYKAQKEFDMNNDVQLIIDYKEGDDASDDSTDEH